MENKNQLLKSTILGGSINGVINGTINWFSVKDLNKISLTVDSISNKETTVFGNAVMLAISLSILLTIISFLTTKKQGNISFFPRGLWLVFRNAFFSFGVMVTFSIVFHRVFGEIQVKPIVSVILVCFTACILSATIQYLTKKELLNLN